ncbi:hypothetical protein KCU81_g5115, partial [Aureobasidium melanogenum]|uniref:Uncharacterized protein n=1 Tax=Aureobasidium melanogenum (strain CBS 110374) TaxID=1043003 RepID=A0A074VSU1_AURM1
MSTAPSSRPLFQPQGENMGPPGKAIARPRTDNTNRPVLGDLTPNAKLDKQQQQQRSGSPLKRQANIFDDGKGFSYIKRRRLSHNNALTRRITPQPPQDQQKAPSPTEHDSHSEGDSGRSSQNSNATRGSFSSLINYDPSSQQQISQQHHQQASSAASMSIRTAAQTLRLRLRIAIYKVRTNQINVPFSRLQIIGKQPTRHQQPQPPAPPSPDALPMAPPPLRPYGEKNTQASEPQSQAQQAVFSTPNIFSNRFMPYNAPSSSPPLAHDPLPRIAREAQARMAAAADRDSLDSEATELAEDHDEHPVAESPLDRSRRHHMLPQT